MYITGLIRFLVLVSFMPFIFSDFLSLTPMILKEDELQKSIYSISWIDLTNMHDNATISNSAHILCSWHTFGIAYANKKTITDKKKKYIKQC